MRPARGAPLRFWSAGKSRPGHRCTNEDIYAVNFFLTEKPAPLLVLIKHEDETEISDSGREALQEPVAKHNWDQRQ